MTFSNLQGQRLGQYELHELLGRGGMGAVYRAQQRSLNRWVAVKVLPTQLATEENYTERFLREARTAAGLEHPYIIPVYDYGTENDVSYVAMRLLTGGTLAERIRQREKTGQAMPSLSEIADLLKKLASALDYAHNQGVIHRDIKATNVMFDTHATPFLVDFGIAKVVSETSSLTRDGASMGTPAYMPPEQWRGDELTHAADQYALAVMIYALVTRKMPFEAGTPYALMHKHLHEMPTPIYVERPDLPPALNEVMERALAKDPEKRFPTTTSFASAFEGAVGGVSLEMENSQFFTFRLERTPVTRTATSVPKTTPLGNDATYTPGTPAPLPTPGGQSRPTLAAGAPPAERRPPWALIGGALALIAVAVAGGIFLFAGGGGSDSSDQPERTQAAIVPSETPTETATFTLTPSATITPTDTATLTSRQVAQATLDYFSTLTATAEEQVRIELELTQLYFEAQTQTATLWTPTFTPTSTFTSSPTATPTNTLTPSATPSATATRPASATPTLSPLLVTPRTPTAVARANSDLPTIGKEITGFEAVTTSLPQDYSVDYQTLLETGAYAYSIRFSVVGEADGNPYDTAIQLTAGRAATPDQILVTINANSVLADVFSEGSGGVIEEFPVSLGAVNGNSYAVLLQSGTPICLDSGPATTDSVYTTALDLSNAFNLIVSELRGSSFQTTDAGVYKGISGVHYQLQGDGVDSLGATISDITLDVWYNEANNFVFAYTLRIEATPQNFNLVKDLLVALDSEATAITSFTGVVTVSLRPLAVGEAALPYSEPVELCASQLE